MFQMEVRLAFLAVLAFTVQANKYLKEKQSPLIFDPQIGRHFRMTKVQEVWQKAEKRLSGSRLVDCYAELKVQDKLQYDLKWLKHTNKGKALLKDNEVTENLMRIIGKYNLGDHSDMKKYNIPHYSKNMDKIKSKDLKKLWKQAHYAGFSDDELEKLEEEFHHHQRKLDEYEVMKNDLVRLEKVAHNALDTDQDLDSARKAYKNKNKETKSKQQKINEHFKDLDKQVSKDLSHEEFPDLRVYQLYAMAKKTSMSEKELASFKDELVRFQRRINKHETLKDMVKESQMYFDKSIQDGKYPQKHMDLVEKANTYEYTVKKYQGELYQRVDKILFQHTEL